MNISHSSTPWQVGAYAQNIIKDKHGRTIATVHGENEQSLATAAHIVDTVNGHQTLDVRQKATVLAALRYYQHQAMVIPVEIDEIATENFTITGLHSREIDALCDELTNDSLVPVSQ